VQGDSAALRVPEGSRGEGGQKGGRERGDSEEKGGGGKDKKGGKESSGGRKMGDEGNERRGTERVATVTGDSAHKLPSSTVPPHFC
jgi:hypothetical protein